MAETITGEPTTQPAQMDDVDDVRVVRDLVSVAIAAGLVAAAIVVPLVVYPSLMARIFVRTPPLLASWLPHTGPGTIPAIALAVGAVVVMPAAAQRLSFGALSVVTWMWALGWTMSLALVDGWRRGVAGRLVRPDEYLAEVPGVHGAGEMLRTFSSRILDGQPDSWTTHVSGHPPGALLTFVTLDRIGLSGGAWAAIWCVVVGTSAAAAVLITVRRIGREDWARRCAPYLVLFPGWVWVGVSADGYFMGVAAWGVCLIALSATAFGGRALAAAVAAGLLLGFAIFLNYGLVLIGAVVLAVLIATRTARPVPWACAAALVVVGAFWAAGFWWFDGYTLVVDRYYQGIASERPFAYWGWANLAATLCALGPAVASGLGRVGRRWVWQGAVSEWRQWRYTPVLLVVGGLVAILAADLSALSKAETERIWLPFSLWVLVSTGLLPRRYQRFWLIAQAAIALVINHLLLTYW